MGELKPCPFCGGKPFFDKDDSGWNWIECSDCHACSNQKVSAMDDCKPILAEEWNNRPDIQHLEQRLAEVEEAICVYAREESDWSWAEQGNEDEATDKDAIEWFLKTFNEKRYQRGIA